MIRHKEKCFFLCFIFLLFFLSFVSAEESDFKLNGWVKSTLSLTKTSSADMVKKLNAPLRIKMTGFINDTLSVNCAYEVFASYEPKKSTQNGTFFNTKILSYRADDIKKQIYSEKDGDYTFNINQDLDRMFFSVFMDSADIHVGRQSISFGSSRFVNPLDVLTSFSFDTIDMEERSGVDAIRCKAFFGEMGEIDGGFVFGDSFKPENSAAYLNTKFLINDSDYTFMVMVFRENLLLGTNFQTSILDAGYWLEAGYVFSDATGGFYKKEDYFRLSTGFDYNFLSTLYGFIEYHYNGAGSSSSGDYLKIKNRTAYDEGRVFLLSRHYLIPGFTFQVTPLCNLISSIMINLTDGSTFISTKMEYSLADDVYIEAGAFIATGEKSSVNYESGNITARSEFGLYNNIYFFSLRFYF